ncbi:MAG: DNA polymerase II, partial [Nanoarchaeota archaeon]|nr:DNA polymerase II [Nanoarchaeota archaeon]
SPYLFVETSKIKKISKYLKKFTIENTKLTNFLGFPVTKISAKNQTELNKLEKAIHKSVETYEADIKPHYRFLIDNNLLGTIDISEKEDYESSERIDRIYHNPEISPPKNSSESSKNLKLNIASIDTEWDESGNLICIGIYSEKIKKVFMITKHELKNTISCQDESDCLEKFKSALIDLDPDIITGWNFIDFDLNELKTAFQKNKISFDLGRDNSQTKLRIQSGFFQQSKADISGRQVIDALNSIRDPFIKEAPTIKFANFESYTLESVSQSLLKKGKLLSGKNRHEQIISLYNSTKKTDHQTLSDYNLLDCQLVYEILEKTSLIDLTMERSELTGMPLDRITSSIASFDSLYIRTARSENLVSPTLSFSQKQERITGGYVQDSKPGIYHNVLVLDFKSLYPSIIKTFNISPEAYVESPSKTLIKNENLIESPNKAYFKNTNGILPQIISKLHTARELAKKENRELSSYAIKIIMNSFFGVLASPNCRYFSLEMANAITHFGQHLIKLTAKESESKFNVKTIYSDTDSVFVESNLSSKKEASSLGKEIEKHINQFYDKYTQKNHNRESFLELEFEKLYISMMIPALRSKSEAGAKKRYAGLKLLPNNKEEMEIVGLEAIRGDWTDAAQEFQVQLLDKVFHKEEVSKFIKSYISNLSAGKMDKKLVYSKSIRKSLK